MDSWLGKAHEWDNDGVMRLEKINWEQALTGFSPAISHCEKQAPSLVKLELGGFVSFSISINLLNFGQPGFNPHYSEDLAIITRAQRKQVQWDQHSPLKVRNQ